MKYESMYEAMEREFIIEKAPLLGDLVCPKHWKKVPFDRWCKLKEGYSSLLVEHLIGPRANPDSTLLDPFSGTAASLVGARNAGLRGAVGIEVNPWMQLISRVKTTPLNNDDLILIKHEIQETLKKTSLCTNESPVLPKLSIIEKVFGQQTRHVFNLMSRIEINENKLARDFMKLALGAILERVSYTRKDGNGIRYPRNKNPAHVIPCFQEQCAMMLEDAERLLVNHTAFKIHEGDSRDARLFQNMNQRFQHVIFSPPYPNCFDYVEVYKVELWSLGFIVDYSDLKILREKTLSSHLNKKYAPLGQENDALNTILDGIDWLQNWGKLKTRAMLANYFNDMENVFKNVHSVMEPGASLHCIVANSCYNYTPIPTDLLLSRSMSKIGLKVERIKIARKMNTSSQQSKEMRENKWLRESIIVATKE